MPLLLQFVSVWVCFSGSFFAVCKCVDVFQWLFCCSLWVCGCVSVALLLQFVSVWMCFIGSLVAACKCVDVFHWLFCCSL